MYMIATNCDQQMCIIATLYILFSYIRTDASQESTLSIPVGNVTENTELTYEFGVRKDFNFSSQLQDGTLSINAYSKFYS